MQNNVGNNVLYYTGSDTIPNCTENVLWVIMSNVQGCTKAQLQQFTSLKNATYRALMPQNSRTIVSVAMQAPTSTSSTGLYSVLCVIVGCVFAFIIIFI